MSGHRDDQLGSDQDGGMQAPFTRLHLIGDIRLEFGQSRLHRQHIPASGSLSVAGGGSRLFAIQAHGLTLAEGSQVEAVIQHG